MDKNWIVTANAGRARIFAQEQRQSAYREIEDMVNDGARQRTAETETDQLGQKAASKSINNTGAPTQPSGYEPHQLPAEHQTELFARSLNDFLERAHQEQRFDHLTLVASPQFLGVLRKFVESKLGSAIEREINKDYTLLSARELQEQLEDTSTRH